MMVYRAGEVRRSEDSLTAPDTAYGMSKLLAEREVNDWVLRSLGRRAHTIRPGVAFGKWENGNFTRLYRSLKGRTFAYVGRSDTIKACVYVKDVVRALLFLADRTSKQEVFNLALPTPITISEICQSMQTVCGLGERKIPVVPFRLALTAGYWGEALDGIGIRIPIHHRRIEKLRQATDISSDAITAAGFEYVFDLPAA
jgi:GlcNAc-P-P-Und epimerase